MEPWQQVCIHVSVYAVLREIRPIDTFYVKYLSQLPDQISEKTIGEEVYPVGCYTNVLFIVIIFLITDYLRYKPIIILNGISGIIYYSLLLKTPTIGYLKLGQVFQVIFRVSEVAYYTYIFAQIKNKDQYQVAYSVVRASVLIGKCGSGILAQVMISCISSDLAGYTYLIYISILGMVLTTLWAINIPPVTFSLYFYKEKEPVFKSILINSQKNVVANQDNFDKEDYKKMNCSEVVQTLWSDFKASYSDLNLVKWSFWGSLSLGGYVMVGQYIQILWQRIEKKNDEAELMNAAVDSLTTFLSAVATYGIGRVDGDWVKHGELIMSLVSLGLGVMLAFLVCNDSLIWSYIYYIIFCCTYQTLLTISSAEVAKFLKRDCYALVFGFNRFVTSVIMSIFTLVIVENTFFTLDIEEQIHIYGFYFIFLGFLYISMTFFSTKSAEPNKIVVLS